MAVTVKLTLTLTLMKRDAVVFSLMKPLRFLNIAGCSKQRCGSPEGEECAHVQLREQLSLGLWVRQTISQRLKCRNHQSFLGVGHVQLDY